MPSLTLIVHCICSDFCPGNRKKVERRKEGRKEGKKEGRKEEQKEGKQEGRKEEGKWGKGNSTSQGPTSIYERIESHLICPKKKSFFKVTQVSLFKASMKSSATTRWKYVQQKQKHFHLWK
jgi:hypothetical protein